MISLNGPSGVLTPAGSRVRLSAAGFDAWGLDFYGFGHSDRYPEMDQPAGDHPPLCVAEDAARQLEAAIRFILGHQNIEKLSLISHSWGSMPTCLFASAHPALIDNLVLFAPIGRRGPRRYETPPRLPAWRIVTLEDQWNRFVEDVPAHEPPVLSRPSRHELPSNRCAIESADGNVAPCT